jgi:hypothetical protein
MRFATQLLKGSNGILKSGVAARGVISHNMKSLNQSDCCEAAGKLASR